MFTTTDAKTQNSSDDIPMIGAEVFIEPGQTKAEIDGWFRLLHENGMGITRIRMFESYMRLADGSWDFTLFDYAFKAGEKYGIKIYANLFPATSFTDVGGFKFPESDENLASIAAYIRQLVTHFKKFSSLYGWVPVNEPGHGSIPDDPFSKNSFTGWKSRQTAGVYNSNDYTILDFAEERFLLYYNTWFLHWLSSEILRYDPAGSIHVNNHNIFQYVAEYDFPQWRNFLTSLGGSAHASWHFDYFDRQQYALAMSANSEILHSGAGNLPWLMTEMQGGNNIYSGRTPLCPAKEEIVQWIWITLATGSKGAIFWCLNPRSSGFEAGEWAMLDFQDKPSDRMLAAASIAKIIQQNMQLFAHAKVVESGISILYCREALWIEKKLQISGASYAGREVGGVMKSALGYFEALSEMGVQANFQEMDEFDFTANDYTGKAIILSHQISIPSMYWPLLKNFVAGGGKLIVDGLTAYYDEYAHCILRQGFPLQDLFGGDITEYKVIDTLFNVQIDGIVLPAHLWQGSILEGTAQPAGTNEEKTIAVRNKYGRGEVLWAPSLLGLGGRLKANYEPLAQLLGKELQHLLTAVPIAFKKIQAGMLMKTIRSGGTYLSVIINKSKDIQALALQINMVASKATILFSNKGGTIHSNNIKIYPEETLVIQWDV